MSNQEDQATQDKARKDAMDAGAILMREKIQFVIGRRRLSAVSAAVADELSELLIQVSKLTL